MEFVNSSIPHKNVTIRPSDKPWYDSEIRRYSRKRDRQKQKAVRTSTQSDWTKYKTLRNKVNNLKRHAKESFNNNLELSLLTNLSNKKKEFWKIVKHFDSVSTIPPLCTFNTSGSSVWHVSDDEKADSLNSFFASGFSLDDSHADLPTFTELTDKILDNIEITEEEIKDVIENLDPNKASGPDLISNRIIKNIARAIYKPLCIIFNCSLREGIFPDIWKLGNLVPLFKKGDRSIPTNYRPVSLLSNLGKIQERIVFKHMYNHLYSNNLLYKYQSGFRPGHSTTFHSLTSSTIYANRLMRNNILAWYFATYQKRLIMYGTGDFYLNFDKRVLRADFWHGILITCRREKNESKSTQLHLPYNQLMLVFPRDLCWDHFYFWCM